MNSKEFLKKLINDIEEKNEIVSKEPHLIINIKVNAETFIPLLHNIKQDLEVLEWLKKSIISKKRIQSLRETANPIYEIILHIPQNILKEVLGNV